MKKLPANSYMLVEDFFNLQRDVSYASTLLDKPLFEKATLVVNENLVEIKNG